MAKNLSKQGSPSAVFNARCTTTKRKWTKGIENLKLRNETEKILFASMGTDGHPRSMLPSDLVLRQELSDKFAELMLKKQADAPPGVSFVLLTLIDDIGLTSDRIPEVKLKALRDKMLRAVASLGLDGVLVMEVHPLFNHPGKGEGGSQLWGGHLLASVNESFNWKDAKKRLLESGAWTCSLGAKPVKIQLIKDTPEDLERVARYLMKPPHSAKSRIPNKKKPGRFKLRDTIEGYRPIVALRIFEALTQIDQFDLIWGVGEGKGIRQALRSHVTKWHRARKADGMIVEPDVDLFKLWFEIRGLKSKNRYLPYRIHGAGLRIGAAVKQRVGTRKTRPGRGPKRPLGGARRSRRNRAGGGLADL